MTGVDASFFRQKKSKLWLVGPAREEVTLVIWQRQRIVLALVIWHLRKQPVDRFGKDPLSQKP